MLSGVDPTNRMSLMSSCDFGFMGSRSVIVLGAGRHAEVAISSLQCMDVEVLGVTTRDEH